MTEDYLTVGQRIQLCLDDHISGVLVALVSFNISTVVRKFFMCGEAIHMDNLIRYMVDNNYVGEEYSRKIYIAEYLRKDTTNDTG